MQKGHIQPECARGHIAHTGGQEHEELRPRHALKIWAHHERRLDADENLRGPIQGFGAADAERAMEHSGEQPDHRLQQPQVIEHCGKGREEDHHRQDLKGQDKANRSHLTRRGGERSQ